MSLSPLHPVATDLEIDMKFARFDNWQTGIVVSRNGKPAILDIAASLPGLARADASAAALLRGYFDQPSGGDWGPLIAAWASVKPCLADLEGRAAAGDSADLVVRELDSVRLRPPLAARRSRVFAIGGNFAAHLKAVTKALRGIDVSEDSFYEEKRQGLGPQGFFVLSETVVACGDPITPPVGTAKLDHEPEVAVIVASGGSNLDSKAVKVWGVAPWHDVSIRDPHLKVGLQIDRGVLPWGLQKNWYSGNTCGPWVAVDELHDLSRIRFTCKVNGELRQSATTADMIWSFGESISYLSRFIPIEPGDLFTSGSPVGTALESGIDGPFLKNGDVVEIEIENVGVLRNRVVM